MFEEQVGVQTTDTAQSEFFVSEGANHMPRFLVILLCNNVEGLRETLGVVQHV